MRFVSCNSSNHRFYFFLLNDPATTEIYTLSLHDALPIFRGASEGNNSGCLLHRSGRRLRKGRRSVERSSPRRSEEHTSELQSHSDLVCRLLLEKKKYDMKHATRNSTSSMTPMSHNTRRDY